MFNAALILETALLFLVAYLLGCVVGYALRRIAVAMARQPTAITQPALVTAAKPAAAIPEERFATALNRSAVPATATPDPELTMQPVRIAEVAPLPPFGTIADRPAAAETSAVPAPASQVTEVVEAPPVMPEPASEIVIASEVPQVDEVAHVVSAAEPVLANDVPQIDEAAHMVERPILEDAPAPEGEATAVAEAEEVAVEVEPEPLPSPEPAFSVAADADAEEELDSLLNMPIAGDEPRNDEAEAMRAIEGDWTPRRSTVKRPPADETVVTEAVAPAPESVAGAEPVHDAPAEESHAEAAMENVRSAVAAATAMAEQVLAESRAVPELEAAGVDALSFEPRRDVGMADSSNAVRPLAIMAPRGGVADDLTAIQGIAPVLARSLNGLGIYHYDQLATWDTRSVNWIEAHFGIRGRIAREGWVEQATELAAGRRRAKH